MSRQKLQPIRTDELTERERKFINARADGLSLLAAWAGSGGDLYQGWQKDAGALERRLRSDVVQVRVGGRTVQMRGSMATEEQRSEILTRLYEMMQADIGDLLKEDGSLDLELAREAGQTRLIRKIEIKELKGKSGEIETTTKLELYSAIEAARSLADILGLKQMPRQNDADRDAMRELVEQKIALVMSEKDIDRDAAVAWMRELPLPEGARRWLM